MRYRIGILNFCFRNKIDASIYLRLGALLFTAGHVRRVLFTLQTMCKQCVHPTYFNITLNKIHAIDANATT